MRPDSLTYSQSWTEIFLLCLQGHDKDKKKPHIKKPLNAFMLYMKVRIKEKHLKLEN